METIELKVDWDLSKNWLDWGILGVVEEIKQWRKLFLTMHVLRRDLKAIKADIVLERVCETKHGYHLYFKLYSERALTGIEIALIQAILGDDNMRVLKNYKRLLELELGVRTVQKWNILFHTKVRVTSEGVTKLSQESSSKPVFQLWELLNRFSEVVGFDRELWYKKQKAFTQTNVYTNKQTTNNRANYKVNNNTT